MRHPVIDTLQSHLAQLPPDARLVVAFSGGMDSSVLLHALAHVAPARVRAIHVDHHLHADSAKWARHCREFAQALGVGTDVIDADVVRNAGTGLEDAARRARSAAFAQALDAGDVLALAHHRGDQAETILLKLLRGAGPEGLGGMRTMRQCGKGYQWRPLLDLPRAVLVDYAQEHNLRWIEDPSNTDTRLRRNFLRAEILPRLAQRWPDAETALAHSAAWARNAAELIDTQAARALDGLRGGEPATLHWRGWLELPAALRDPVLRRWLRELRLDEPAHFHVVELERQLRAAAQDRNPCVAWDDTQLRRWRDLVYAMRTPRPVPEAWEAEWNGLPLALPAGGALSLDGAILDDPLIVRYRRGGEKIKPAGSAHTRELRAVLQESGMPPWRRERIPMIWRGDELLAAGDLVLGAPLREMLVHRNARIVLTME